MEISDRRIRDEWERIAGNINLARYDERLRRLVKTSYLLGARSAVNLLMGSKSPLILLVLMSGELRDFERRLGNGSEHGEEATQAGRSDQAKRDAREDVEEPAHVQ